MPGSPANSPGVPDYLASLYDLSGQVAVVTGGTGTLGGAMAVGLARAGAKVGVLGRRTSAAEARVSEIAASGGEAMPLVADVLNRAALDAACQSVLDRWGRIDILINCAGGNSTAGTVAVDGSFFDLTQDGLQNVIDLNLMGTLLPTQVFGAPMARQRAGCIINISSLSVPRALTRVVAYGAAKAGIENFTRWLAIELVRKHGPGLRVNAIAPGFFLAEMNKPFMLNPDGSWSARGQAVIDHSPSGRFGDPQELVGGTIWLCSKSASFVNGAVIQIDGGFGAFSGV
ncbi:MAG: SDR family oxidoreductase [Chloroflexi bacterium]|nr:SDR family oxidoreductase [Chloroflexota bacterium]